MVLRDPLYRFDQLVGERKVVIQLCLTALGGEGRGEGGEGRGERGEGRGGGGRGEGGGERREGGELWML